MTQQVYVLEDRNSGLLKIGVSLDVQRRVGQVNRDFGCEAEVIGVLSVTDALRTERFIHGMLEDCRVVGEWFEVPQRKRNYLLAYFTDKAMERPKFTSNLPPRQMPQVTQVNSDGWSEVRAAVKEAMKREGVSQVELAKELEMSRVNLTRALSGRSGKVPELWQRLLDRFGLELTVRPKDDPDS